MNTVFNPNWLRHTFAMIIGIIYCAVASAQPITHLSARISSQSQIEDLTNPTLGAAPSAAARPMISLAISLLKDFEGWVATAYDDPAGYCTIGYGHLIALKRCSELKLGAFSKALSEDEGEIILELDTRTARLSVQQLLSVELTDNQFGALSSFVFNIGKQNFARSTMLALINAKEFAAAASEFRRWIKSNGQVFGGLVDRRSCEAGLFLGQLTLDTKGRFARQQCKSLGAAPTDGSLVDIRQGENSGERK